MSDAEMNLHNMDGCIDLTQLDQFPIKVYPPVEDFLSVNTGEMIRNQLGILTDTELANALRVTTNTLATWRGKKQGPKATSLGRAVYYRYSDVKSWIELEASQSATA